MDELMEVLEELRPDVDFTKDQLLITDGILDSIDVMSLVTALSDAFDIKVKPADMTPDNFNTPESILKLVEKLQEE